VRLRASQATGTSGDNDDITASINCIRFVIDVGCDVGCDDGCNDGRDDGCLDGCDVGCVGCDDG